MADEDQTIEVASVGGRKPRVMARRILSEILQPRAEEGDASAARILRLKENPGRFLAVIQIGINFLGFLASAFVRPCSAAIASASSFAVIGRFTRIGVGKTTRRSTGAHQTPYGS